MSRDQLTPQDLRKIAALDARDEPYKLELERIGEAIGYGRSCQILGDLWDAKLQREFGLPPGRGAMERRRDVEQIEAILHGKVGKAPAKRGRPTKRA